MTDFKLIWRGLALILACLSLDEIGSFHERLLGHKTLFYFAVGIGLAMIIPFIVTFYRRPETRRTSKLICIAFGLFGSVAGQEQLEHAVDWGQFPKWIPVLRSAVEEGTELFATFLLFAAVVPHRSIPGRKAIEGCVADLRKAPAVVSLVLLGLALNLAICLVVVPNLTDLGHRGNPAVWYPVVLNFMLFSVTFWIGQDSSRWMGAIWRMISAAFLMSSVALMTDPLILVPGVVFTMPDVWSRLLVLYGWQTILIVWIMRQKCIRPSLGVITLVSTVALVSLHVYLADTESLALFLYGIFSCVLSLAVVFASRRPADNSRVRPRDILHIPRFHVRNFEKRESAISRSS